jgi:hypothetical protein
VLYFSLDRGKVTSVSVRGEIERDSPLVNEAKEVANHLLIRK